MRRIAVNEAKPDMILAKEIYNRTGWLLLRKGTILNEQWIDKLMDYGVASIYVEGDSSQGRFNADRQALKLPRRNPVRLPENVPDMVSLKLREEAELVVRELMAQVGQGQEFSVFQARRVIESIVDHFIKTKFIVTKHADIKALDDYTITHSVNVCILSISTGIMLGYSKVRLRELGIGALLHDIGKSRVSEDIITKQGALTENEYEEARRHTFLGHEILMNHPDITANAAKICLQHHEYFNGDGYPNGLRDEEIHEYSKIVAITDVYDALTADRCYKVAMQPYEAMEILIASSGYQFDPKIVKVFVENSDIYPVGSTVELGSGQTATVVATNKTLPTRPQVRLITDVYGKPVSGETVIDLMSNPTVFIKRILKFSKINRL